MAVAASNAAVPSAKPCLSTPHGVEAVQIAASSMPGAADLMAHHRFMLPRGTQSSSQQGVAGEYLNIYLPYGTQQIAGKEIAENVTLSVNDEGIVEIDGLCGQGANTLAESTWYYADPVNLKGTYDASTATLTCSPGQVLSRYVYNDVDKRVQLYAADMAEGKVYETAEIKFELKGDKLVCLSDLYLQVTDNVTGESEAHLVEVAPVMNLSNGVIKYIFTTNGENYYQLQMPTWYKFVRRNGVEYMRVAYLTQLNGRGYVVEWRVDGNQALAEQQVAWSERLFTSNKTYNLVSATKEGVCTDIVVADITDRGNIAFPQNFGGNEYPFWACQDYANYNFGINQAGLIMGHPGETIDLGDENPPEPGDMSKAYVSFYTSSLDTYLPDKTLTEPIYITINEDNTVEVDGISGIGVKASALNEYMTDVFNATGTYDPDKKTISLPAGQMLAKLNGTVDLRLMWGELQPPFTVTGNPTYNSRNAIVFDMVNDSTWQCRNDIVIQMLVRTIPQGVYSTILQPTLKRANGEISYATTVSDRKIEIKQPIWYEFSKREGNEYLTTSSLNNMYGSGYVIEWTVDGRRARATEAVAFTNNNSQYYLCSVDAIGNPVKSVEANINHRDSIVLPAVYKEWSIWDVTGGYSLGINTTAVIKGVPNDWGDLEPEPEAPETLGVIGELVGGVWDPAVVTMLTKDGDVFSGTADMSGGYFSFCEHATDGSGLGKRYGALTDGAAITLGQPPPFVAGNIPNPFKIDIPQLEFPMTVSFKVDFSTMTVTLTDAAFSGIDSVLVDNPAAPVQYYNLQGLPISNPVKGQICIVRRGSNVSKVMIE
ncbi:MAG: hypothetical protein K2H87_00305 [Duncaniella sp.]|nr:hypothetical protein [Duncaniella sp.]